MKNSIKKLEFRYLPWMLAALATAGCLFGLATRESAFAANEAQTAETVSVWTLTNSRDACEADDIELKVTDDLGDVSAAVCCEAVGICSWYSGTKCPAGLNQVGCPCRQN